MFIAAIKMVIGPIIFCTVVHGIAGMQDMKKVGRVGLKALVYFEADDHARPDDRPAGGELLAAGRRHERRCEDHRYPQHPVLRHPGAQHERMGLCRAHHSQHRGQRIRRGRRAAGAVLRPAVRVQPAVHGRARPSGGAIHRRRDGCVLRRRPPDHACRADRCVRRHGLHHRPLWSRHPDPARPAHGERLYDLPAVHLRRTRRRRADVRLQHPQVHPLHQRRTADRTRHLVVGIGAAAHDAAHGAVGLPSIRSSGW